MKIVWESKLTEEMVQSVKPDELELLIADLDDAVQAVCEDWGI